MKQDIFGLTITDLEKAFLALGLKKFRAKQVFQWIYQKSVFDFNEMHNLSKKDIAILEENFCLLPRRITVLRQQNSADGMTSKLLLSLPDGNSIETVLMHHDYGYSVCVSSQVGCDMHCAFCASGLNGAIRNLTLPEIVAQVYLFNERLKPQGAFVSRIVVMGSGEPMLNYDNVFGALAFLHQESTSFMSYRNMTVSTCGIIPGIKRMTDDAKPINLAVSLHAVKMDLRSSLMPVNKGFAFTDVLEAAEEYALTTGREITYEYILLKDVNDSEEDALLLSNFLRYKHATVNLIPANPVPEKGFARPDEKTIDKFFKILVKNKTNATVRKEMGKDIAAACGQLRAKFAQEEKKK
ncbi:MAG: 23S rRNA (adenine(2503)-C(2))-methyltransferase RlmN [Phascolarctobacterium sp.]|nr:23S rRNA (adenine(2503)-C(2))-methyltransferase RlmN [Phascolarctobacterium sp.]